MKLLMVDDDDVFRNSLAELLIEHGLVDEVTHAADAAQALESASREGPFDLAIVDMVLPVAAQGPQTEGVGTHLGEMIARAHLATRVVGLSNFPTNALVSRATRAFSDVLPKRMFRGSATQRKRAAELLIRATDDSSRPIVSFIVHGRDERAKLALKNLLQNDIGLPEPRILHELPNQGRTIIEKLESGASLVDFVFVLLLPEDDASNAGEPTKRARQNVVFEAGFFYGKLQRTEGRVFLLYQQPVELPSDLSGIVYIDISGGLDTARTAIEREVRAVLEDRSHR